MRKSNLFSDLFSSVFLTILIISGAIVFTLFFKPLYYFDISFLNISSYSGMEVSEIIKNYNALIDYNSIFHTGELVFPSLSMSLTGKIHFEEVKNIFSAIQITFIISLIISIVFFVLNFKRKRFKFLLYTVYLTAFVIVGFALLSFINWEWFFSFFHKVLFNNSFWVFDPYYDPVITILPNEFFAHCAIMIIALIAIFTLLLFFLYRSLNKKFSQK